MRITQHHASLSVQRARAETIGSGLATHGFSKRPESCDDHPGAHAVTRYTRGYVKLLVLSLGMQRGQIVEIAGAPRPRTFPTRGGHAIGARPSWRLTAYDPPAEAILAAALAAGDSAPELGAFEVAGWTAVRPHTSKVSRPRVATYTRPDGAVVASFHMPTFTPSCERCAEHGDHGDAGGWLVAGLGVTCDATAHTPGSVISAFALALPSARLFPSRIMPKRPGAESEEGK
ncbi:hypothetical protein KGQ19_01390 [Catenulispora sp. NL8]|uniref:Uncharacterized protein n=1 Tax=Catenulispora pinistramenti TaxID=2705254 RepID=A0ABS5KGX3_9ACTN|nr:hypothetical protein [Catenulispora pinistramenti]MBS2545514.1 hypothetical protein [Catenulispora pinistramenti]